MLACVSLLCQRLILVKLIQSCMISYFIFFGLFKLVSLLISGAPSSHSLISISRNDNETDKAFFKRILYRKHHGKRIHCWFLEKLFMRIIFSVNFFHLAVTMCRCAWRKVYRWLERKKKRNRIVPVNSFHFTFIPRSLCSTHTHNSFACMISGLAIELKLKMFNFFFVCHLFRFILFHLRFISVPMHEIRALKQKKSHFFKSLLLKIDWSYYLFYSFGDFEELRQNEKKKNSLRTVRHYFLI